ncbi:hypothetical protein PSP20601_05510 [Pandoraea sputorum]|nr:hypothetical protein PSP20601_05510 [Pandoraea sputorum]
MVFVGQLALIPLRIGLRCRRIEGGGPLAQPHVLVDCSSLAQGRCGLPKDCFRRFAQPLLVIGVCDPLEDPCGCLISFCSGLIGFCGCLIGFYDLRRLSNSQIGFRGFPVACCAPRVGLCGLREQPRPVVGERGRPIGKGGLHVGAGSRSVGFYCQCGAFGFRFAAGASPLKVQMIIICVTFFEVLLAT